MSKLNSQSNKGIGEKEIENTIKKYFQSEWGSLSLEEEEKIGKLVYFPLKNPKLPGGLTQEGVKWAKDNKLEEILKLSKQHREKTRIEIHAPLKSAWLFAISHERELDQEEKDSLLSGIALSSPLDRMQTVKKGGKMLAAGFVDKLTILYKHLVRNKNMSGNEDFIKIVKKAAQLHKEAETKDKEISEKILNI